MVFCDAVCDRRDVFFDQTGFEVRCEWGAHAIDHLAEHAAAIVIVDVLSFCTCVDVAVARGARVVPHRWKDDTARERAAATGALLADPRSASKGTYTLSPSSLEALPAGASLILPSPNGATLTARAAALRSLGPTTPRAIFAACLRNASAVARHVGTRYASVLLVAAGERWPDDTLRPAVEDWLGCGAIADALGADRPMSPEAAAARDAFRAARADLLRVVASSASGRELDERGFARDVAMAAAHDVSGAVPILDDGFFRAA